MLHTVYKTVCLLNGKFYVGYHKTEDPSDGYLGSGTYIRRAVRKHGRVNFRKEVLFIFSDVESAMEKEKELVELHRTNPLCMNLTVDSTGRCRLMSGKQ